MRSGFQELADIGAGTVMRTGFGLGFGLNFGTAREARIAVEKLKEFKRRAAAGTFPGEFAASSRFRISSGLGIGAAEPEFLL